MNKIVIGIAAIGIALTGCASNAPTPTVTVTATPDVTTPAPAPTLEPEDAFIAAVESEYGPLTTRQEKQVIDLAYDVCVSFDTIGVQRTLRGYLTQVTTRQEAKTLGFIIGAGTSAFCPEYGDELGLGVSA